MDPTYGEQDQITVHRRWDQLRIAAALSEILSRNLQDSIYSSLVYFATNLNFIKLKKVGLINLNFIKLVQTPNYVVDGIPSGAGSKVPKELDQGVSGWNPKRSRVESSEGT